MPVALTGSCSHSRPSSASTLKTFAASPPMLRRPQSAAVGARHIERLNLSRTLGTVSYYQWRQDPTALSPDAIALQAARRSFSQAQLHACEKGTEDPTLNGVRSVTNLSLPLRPPPRMTAPPPPRHPSNHAAFTAANRAAARRALGVLSAASVTETAAAHVAAAAIAAKGSARPGCRNTSIGGHSRTVTLGLSTSGDAPVLDAERLDPLSERLFSEPRFVPPPRQKSFAELCAELRRTLGEEGSLARTLAEGRGNEVGLPSVVETATATLRNLPALRAFGEETLRRLVRLGRLQRRKRYQHFYHEGARPDGLFVLVSGTLRLCSGSDQHGGREVKPPAAFGLEALAALGVNEGPANATTAVLRVEGAMATQNSVAILVPGDLSRSAILELAAGSPFYPFELPMTSGTG
jgi:hypothetical protein